MLKRLFDTPDDWVFAWMRLLTGIVFWPHGAQKLLGLFGGGGFQGTMRNFSNMGIPSFLVFVLIMVEFFAPIALVLGVLTRLAALAIAVDMFVAVVMVHRHIGFFMNWGGKQKGEGFEFHLLVFAVSIPLIIRGAGAFSLDRAISVKSTA
jgi:putative oxidoreductase